MTRRQRRWWGRRGSDIHSVSKVRATFISPSKYASVDVLFTSWQAKSFCGCVWFMGFFMPNSGAQFIHRNEYSNLQNQTRQAESWILTETKINNKAISRRVPGDWIGISMPLRYLYQYRHRFIWQVSQSEGKVPVSSLGCILILCVCVCVAPLPRMITLD